MRPAVVRATITVVFMFPGMLATWAAEQPRSERNQPLQRWTLATTDTKLVVGVGTDQRPYIQELSSPAGWNWTASSSPFPLLGRVDVEGAPQTLDWGFQQGTEDKTDGTKVTLIFANADPALELTSIWHARRGPGPVRHTMFIKNKSPKQVTIYQQESLDLQFISPELSQSRMERVRGDRQGPGQLGSRRSQLLSSHRRRCAPRL